MAKSKEQLLQMVLNFSEKNFKILKSKKHDKDKLMERILNARGLGLQPKS